MSESEAAAGRPSGLSSLIHNKTAQFILIISLIAIAGFALQLVATRWGIGMVTGDEVGYISSARNLSNGLGLSVFQNGQLVPMTHWAPLFPFLLYLLNFLGADPMTGARFLNAFLFAANIALVGVIIRKCTRENLLAPVFGSLVVMSSFFLLQLHSTALTEPAFLLFAFLGFLLLANYFESEKLPWLIASAAAAALATLTRYAGISLVITAIAAIALIGRRNTKVMLRDSIIFAFVSLLPVACWFLLRNTGAAGEATDRTIAFHPPPVLDTARTLVRSVATWIFPYPKMSAGVKWGVAAVILVVLALFLAALAYTLFKVAGKSGIKQLFTGTPDIIRLLAVFVVVYMVFIYFYIIFIDADGEFSSRTLSPVFLAVLIIVVYGAHRAIRESGATEGGSFLKTSALALAAVLLAAYLMGAAVWVSRTFRDGLGFEGKMWEESEAMELVEKIPEKTLIYTNSPEAVYVQTERSTRRIPIKRNNNSLIENPDYKEELSKVKERIDEGRAVFVWFKNYGSSMYTPDLDELFEVWDLQPASAVSDGAVYR